MASSLATLSPESYTLEKIKKGVSINLGATAIDSMQIRVHEFVGQKIVEATFQILADKLVEDKYKTQFTWRTPKTWWQQLKKEHAPRWFKKRYPVQYKNNTYSRTVKFTRYAEYPKASVISQDPKYTTFYMQQLGGMEVIRDQVEDL